MHFISRIILHHFLATYNHFFKFPRKAKNKTHGDWPKPPISMGDVKKVLSSWAAMDAFRWDSAGWDGGAAGIRILRCAPLAQDDRGFGVVRSGM
jgi:hypothetical protein